MTADKHSHALYLADALDAVNTNNADSLLVQMAARSAATEMRRLYYANNELLDALKRIAMAAEATACNVGWVAHHARAAIAKATGD